ncbi:SprT-like domain-containing protein [Luteolibacter flavescens]|uniref:SprT-like domain-containing protein n=1 Tax=Luteolibacter flavescens TaxID=1859460 RepID=A0ABT3FW64_9BACT|nr:SprT-like domain-containing protein [Luteolibacter flavescens]MCW1887792.1 SprT-like domain-containing protein [Luteolibacter flavescens]
MDEKFPRENPLPYCQSAGDLLEAGWMAWAFRQWSINRVLKPRAAAPSPDRRQPAKVDGGLTEWCREKAEFLDLPELARRVQVSWNARMQTTAGRAWWPDRLIELNPKLKEQAQEEIWRTLRHELAHLVAYERAGRRRIEAHGPEWRAACAELGIPDEQPFHTLPFKRKRMKRNYAYICPQCLTTIRRVKRISRAVACYACCRKFSGGLFDRRFELLEQKLER